VNVTESTKLWLPDGTAVTMAAPLAGATGEGTVFAVADRPDWAAKVFHPGLSGLDAKLDKVAAMVGSPPPEAIQSDGFVVLAWPTEILTDGTDPVGFVMPRISTSTSVELHTMSNPSNRSNPMPSAPQWTQHATWNHLVNVAANLCLALESVHRVEAVIGDFQERNILVSDTTRVTLVDCDSMQFTDSGGRQFLCPVGRPEFTAPELAGLDLRAQAREQPSDLFALAVHVHQLLMAGNHPFLRGHWTGAGEQPHALALARSGDWAGGPGSRLLTHPLAPPVTYLPPDIQQLFVRAFSVGASDPGARPSAGEWRQALSHIQITTCGGRAHQIPLGCAVCPWCAIDAERAARRARRVPMNTGPHPVPAHPSAPLPPPGPQPPPPDTFLGMNPRTYLIMLAVVVSVVVLAAIIIIAVVLSG